MRSAQADLKEACVEAAHQVISEQGLEQLSLREIARRLKVSHQAPYKHFPSRDHLLAEVIRRSFQRFAQHLDARPKQEVAHEDLSELGRAYLEFALRHPLEYRLMFGTPWPSVTEHPELLREARHSFRLLLEAIQRLRAGTSATGKDIELDALYVWTAMHGVASALNSDVLPKLELLPETLAQAVPHAMARVSAALGVPEDVRLPIELGGTPLR
jgi:AcrR family transcriptional regulator